MDDIRADHAGSGCGYSYNSFDLTKVWPRKDHSLIEVSVMELNRNPEKFSSK